MSGHVTDLCEPQLWSPPQQPGSAAGTRMGFSVLGWVAPSNGASRYRRPPQLVPLGFGSARCNPNQSLEMTNKPSGIRLTIQSYSHFGRFHER